MASKAQEGTAGPLQAAGKLLSAITRIVDVGATTIEQSVSGLGDLAAELTDASVNGTIVMTMHSEKLLGETVAEIGAASEVGRKCAQDRKAQRRKEKLARQAA